MADDWIKVRTDLPDDPNVLIMAAELSMECPTVVGHLVSFWGWMDKHTPDGKLKHLSEALIDKRMCIPGFAAALRKVEWLLGKDGALFLPKFERHNGWSAKARALETEAKRIRRANLESGGNLVGQVSDNEGSKRPTREEKRREEKNTGDSNSVTGTGQATPRRTRRRQNEFLLPNDWHPALSTVRTLNAIGIPNEFFLTGTLLQEFRLYWRERQEARTAKAWETTFKLYVKNKRDFLGNPEGNDAAK